MNKSNKNKVEINVRTSVNVDTVDQNIYSFGDLEAPALQNNGVERDGGILPVYEQQLTLSSGQNIITDQNKVLNFNNGVVSLDGKNIANISPYGVELNTQLAGYDDVVLTSDAKILGVNISSSALIITELDYNGNILRSRSTAFTGLASAYNFYTSLSFVRYDGIKYTDSLQFLLRLGDTTIVLNESTPTQSIEKSIISSNVLGTNIVYAAITYGPYFIVAGQGGRLGSFDGTAWKNYDGSGTGTGPYDNGTVIGTNDIRSLAIYRNTLVVAGNGGRIASFDGTNWRAYTTAGTGLWNNASVISTNNVTAMCVWKDCLIVGGHLGKLGSWSGTAWTPYNSVSTVYPCDNATLIGAGSINSIQVYLPSYETDSEGTLVVAGAGGRIGLMRIAPSAFTAGTVSTFTGAVNLIASSNGVLAVSDGGGSGRYAYSTDNGLTFTASTVSTFTNSVSLINNSNGVLTVRDSTTGGRYAYSTDNGITFTASTVPTFVGAVAFLNNSNGVLLVYDNNTGGRYAYSTDDGLTFTASTVPTFTGAVRLITYSNGVLTVYDSLGSGRYAYSLDNGQTFTASTVSTFTGSVTFLNNSNGVLTVADSAGRYAYSTDDGLTFTASTVSTFTGAVTFLNNSNGVLLVRDFNGGGRYAYSLDDGLTFTASTVPTFTGGPALITYSNGVLTVTGGSGRYAYSTNDGLTFTASTVPTFTGAVNLIANSNGVLTVTGGSGRYAYSTDNGISFTASTVPTFTGVVTFLNNSNGVLLVSDTGGRYAYSLDNGITFTASTVSTFTGIVAFLNNSNGVLSVRDFNGGGRYAYATINNFAKYIYTATSNYTLPTNNATVIGSNNILSTSQYLDWLVVSGVGGRVGSFSRGAWFNYNTVGLTDTGTNMGTSDINATQVYDGKLVTAGASGRVASFLSDNSASIFNSTPTSVAISTFTGQPTFLNYSGGIYTVYDSAGGGRYAYSADGRTWVASTVSTFTGVVQFITYSNGVLLVKDGGGSGRYAYSTDNGITFTASTISTFTGTVSLINNSGGVLTFRDGGGSGRYAYSLDNGQTFTVGTIPTFTLTVNLINNSGGVLTVKDGLAGGGGRYAYSLDNGLTFTAGTIPTFTNSVGLINNSNGVLLVSDGGGSGRYAYSLDNGLTFTAGTIPTFTNSVVLINNSDGVLTVYDNAPGGRYAYSLDNGLTFTASIVPTLTGVVRLITYSNGVLTVYDNGGSGRYAYSLDNGQTFTASTVSTFTGVVVLINNSNGVLTVYDNGGSGRYAYSTDNGITFTASTVSTFTGAVNLIGYNNNILYVYDSATSNRYAWSLDNGLTFTASTVTSFTNSVRYTYFNNGLWLFSDTTGGRVAYFYTPLVTKYIYNGSAGIANNGTVIGANAINDVEQYTDKLMFVGAASRVGAMFTDYSFAQFWTEGATSLANLLEGFNSFNYVYCWRYDNGKYLLNLVGNTNNKSFVFNNSTKAFITLKARYVWPQKYLGKVRHITSGDPVYDASKIESIGLQGYTDFITYSDAIVFPTAAYASITGTPKKNIGWGGVDHTFTIGANIYNWVPEYKPLSGSLYQVLQSQTNTLIDAYFKLTNNTGVQPSVPFEIRLNWINGVMSYLSVARLSGTSDNLGTLLTNVGEFDDTYTPQIEADSTVLYKYNNSYYIIKVGTNVPNRLQQIDQYLYKVNTISPFNIVDTLNSTMNLGSLDYNGRVLFNSSAAVATVASQVNTLSQRKYTNTIDVGNKLITITTPTSSNMEAIGYKIVDSGQFSNRFVLDTYINNVYSYSTFADGSEFVDTLKSGLVYIPTTILPVPLNSIYEGRVAKTLINTQVLESLYDGYKIGNIIEGEYTFFTLIGQEYAFDGKNIYLVALENGLVTSLIKIADAYGMRYIATSPTAVYFYSNFDNSIYTFDGGRSVTKTKRLNKLSSFIKGIYNTKDNTLLLETDDEFVWMRDGIWTVNDKKATQLNVKLFNTTDGIVIANDGYSWRYTYEPVVGSVIIPLTWQSAFFGLNTNEKSTQSEIVFTIYNENKETQTILGKLHTVDENDNYNIQEVRWDVDPHNYSSAGYVKLRIKPEVYRALGTSLELYFDKKNVLYDVVAQFNDASDGITEARKTR